MCRVTQIERFWWPKAKPTQTLKNEKNEIGPNPTYQSMKNQTEIVR